ncbi:ATP-binding cassette subfamily C member 8 [Tanacetum coccineum]
MVNEGESNVGGASGIVVDENRGREESHQGDKRSRERVEESHQHLKELGSNFAKLREDFKSALNVLGGKLGGEIHDLRGLSLCKRFMASRGGNTSNISPKVDVTKPSPFMGKREARAVDDLFLDMEQYMEGVNIVDDASNIKTATRYLNDTAALWWRRLYGDIKQDTCTVSSWANFVQDLKKQFYLENAKHEAKSRLHKLKRSRTIREWAKTELERRGVQDLAMAIAHAEALIDLSEWRLCKPTNEESGYEQGREERQVKDWDYGA